MVYQPPISTEGRWHGFTADGTEVITEDGITEMRMVRHG